MCTLCSYFNLWVFRSLNYRGKLCRLSRYTIYFRLNITMEISSRFDELKSTANTAPTSGGFRGTPPYGPKFFQFHAVFRKIRQNHMLAPPSEGWRPLLRGILDQPLSYKQLMKYLFDLLFTPSWADTPRQTPPGRHPPADTPRQTALGRHPLGRHPLLADIPSCRHLP